MGDFCYVYNTIVCDFFVSLHLVKNIQSVYYV